MEAHAQGGTDYAGKCFICHSDCPDQAQTLREAVRERFPHVDGDVRVFDIGTIIAAHCGPHTLAVFFLGDERAPYPLPKDGRDYRY
jgi:fatty acid-binding protein DegV